MSRRLLTALFAALLLPTAHAALPVGALAPDFSADAAVGGQAFKFRLADALKQGQPGSKEFRMALRDALETTKDLSGAHGVYNMSAKDHLGLDQRARVMVRIDNGSWKLAR